MKSCHDRGQNIEQKCHQIHHVFEKQLLKKLLPKPTGYVAGVQKTWRNWKSFRLRLSPFARLTEGKLFTLVGSHLQFQSKFVGTQKVLVSTSMQQKSLEFFWCPRRSFSWNWLNDFFFAFCRKSLSWPIVVKWTVPRQRRVATHWLHVAQILRTVCFQPFYLSSGVCLGFQRFLSQDHSSTV